MYLLVAVLSKLNKTVVIARLCVKCSKCQLDKVTTAAKHCVTKDVVHATVLVF